METTPTAPREVAASAVAAMLAQANPGEAGVSDLAYVVGRLARVVGADLRVVRASLVDGWEFMDTEYVTPAPPAPPAPDDLAPTPQQADRDLGW